MGDTGEDVGVAEKGPSAWAQATAALVVVAAIGGGLLVLQKNTADAVDEPATCSADAEAGKEAEEAAAAKRLSGSQLCTALNRADLPTLLGTPREQARGTGQGTTGSATSLIGVVPEATVTLDTYTVKLSRSYDDLPLARLEGLLDGAQKKTILGHPAVLYTSQTIAVRFDLGGGKSESAPGSVARSLLVAPDAKDAGGSYEIAVWRQDGVMPDDAALIRVAQQVLPTVPGWTAG
ncbi:DUF6215 domain-containing protein [Streptomyces sp. NPDC050263]|uniref:DUF6215 domain-containing protein n=1 Tax=Streptomyces sp. NPDC050263 TaxID=3155037 RepID=UPI0034280390